MFTGKPMHPIIAVVAGVVAIAAIGGGVWVWRQYFDSYHLATVREGVLYRDGVRSPGQFAAAMRRVKPKTVVSLLDDGEISREPFASETAYCREKGIDFVRIPIQLGGWPTAEQVKTFLAITEDASKQPVLVHCAQGVRRTGMMVAAYQETVMNYDRQRAKGALMSFGHSQRTVGDVERFIDVYDPKEQRMTEEFGIGEE